MTFTAVLSSSPLPNGTTRYLRDQIDHIFRGIDCSHLADLHLPDIKNCRAWLTESLVVALAPKLHRHLRNVGEDFDIDGDKSAMVSIILYRDCFS